VSDLSGAGGKINLRVNILNDVNLLKPRGTLYYHSHLQILFSFGTYMVRDKLNFSFIFFPENRITLSHLSFTPGSE